MLIYADPLADITLEDTGVGEQINDLLYELSATDAQIKYYEEQSQSTFEKIDNAIFVRSGS